MKHTKRILCLLLALLMLLPLAVACNKKGDEGEGDGTEAGDVAGSNAAGNAAASGDGSDESGEQFETDENGYRKDKLDGLDFGGKEIRILACNQAIYKELDISSKDMNASELNRAIYTRDMKVKARLNVNPVYQFCARADMQTLAKELEVTGDVDVYAPYSRSSAVLMMEGYTRNLIGLNYLDFSAPWWAQDLISKVTIHDKMYVASGDISPSLFAQTFSVCFNKKLFDEVKGDKLEKYDAESLYEMVEEGTWTLEAMLDFAKGLGMNQDGEIDATDSFGITCHFVNLDPFYQAMGLKVLEQNPDGSVRVSEDLFSAKAHGVVETLVTFFNTPDAYQPQEGDPNAGVQTKAFYNGNVLFNVNSVVYVPIMINNGVETGLLPMPKYDTDQERYYNIAGFAFLVWSISRSVTDKLDACAAFMECMASESYRTTSPALYEDVYKGRSSDSADDYKMWGVVKESVEIEGGRLFVDVFDATTYGVFRKAVMGRTTDYKSHAESYRETMNGYADGLNNLMKIIEDVYV